MRTAELITTRLKLEPFSPQMISDAYISWLNDPEVVRFSEQRHHKHDYQSCLAYVLSFDHERDHMWAIRWSGRHVGNVTAHRNPEGASADIGILIGERDAWGKGIGSEVWLAVCDWLLSDPSIVEVTAGAVANNRAMIRIFEKAAMNIEVIRNSELRLHGRPVEVVTARRARS